MSRQKQITRRQKGTRRSLERVCRLKEKTENRKEKNKKKEREESLCLLLVLVLLPVSTFLASLSIIHNTYLTYLPAYIANYYSRSTFTETDLGNNLRGFDTKALLRQAGSSHKDTNLLFVAKA